MIAALLLIVCAVSLGLVGVLIYVGYQLWLDHEEEKAQRVPIPKAAGLKPRTRRVS